MVEPVTGLIIFFAVIMTFMVVSLTAKLDYSYIYIYIYNRTYNTI